MLDTFARRPEGPVAAFTLSRGVTDELGLYTAAWAPQARGPALVGPVLDLTRQVGLDEEGVLTWVRPYGWQAVESLLLTTDDVAATMSIEALPPGVRAAQWHREVVERLGFLRDIHRVADHAIDVDGLRRARLAAFDWQPRMSGRRFSVLVSGVVDGSGVAFQAWGVQAEDAVRDLLARREAALRRRREELQRAASQEAGTRQRVAEDATRLLGRVEGLRARLAPLVDAVAVRPGQGARQNR